MSEQHVFVTGGSGFIGSRVVALLVEAAGRSPWSAVRALARSDSSAAQLAALGAKPVPGSLEDAAGAWRAVASSAAWVVHCAQPRIEHGEDYGVRLRMEANLLEALEPGTVRRAVFVYGSSYHGEVLDESAEPRRPIGLGRAFEPAVAAFHARRLAGLDAVAAFPGAVYGRGSWFLEMFLESIVVGDPVVVCDPAPRWPFVQVDDCAAALVALLEIPAARLDEVGREVIVADDRPVALDRFIEDLGRRVGRAPLFLRKTRDELRAMLPRLMADYLAADMPHSNARLRRLGVGLRHPTIEEGLASLDLARARR